MVNTDFIAIKRYVDGLLGPQVTNLDSLNDVVISGAINGQALIYNSGTSKWENVNLTTSGVAEGSNLYFTNERVDDRVSSLLVAGTNITLTYNDPANTLTVSAAGASGIGEPFVTIGNPAALTNERALTGTTNQVIITDNGANSTVVLSTPQNIHSGATPTFAGLILTGFSGVLKAIAGVIAGGSTTSDLPEGTNLYFTDERAQDAVGTILTDSSNIDLTYNDAGNTITADLFSTAVTPGSYGSATQVGTFTVDAKGRLTAATNVTITGTSSGTYTPMLTNVVNLTASTAYQCQWMRVGNIITISGKVDVDPILTATSTQLGISFPVASNLANTEDCAGTAFAPDVAGQGAAILGDAVNDRAQMQWMSVDVTNQPFYFTFTYEVL